MVFTMSIDEKSSPIGLTCLKCKTLYLAKPSMNEMIVCIERKWVIMSICMKCKLAEEKEEEEDGLQNTNWKLNGKKVVWTINGFV